MSTLSTIDTVVIGAGHAGLSVSRLLTRAGRDHVVLDRGRLAERWRSERWDSLHLLTPSWMTRLPGWCYGGPDPEAYLSARGFVRYLERYADSFDAPVLEGATVQEVAPLGSGSDSGPGYRVVTDRGGWGARNVVVATGPHGVPRRLPGLANLPVVPANEYRNPGRLPAGGVLVVGASSSGVQIADELNRAGREVTLAVGRHSRMPRRYRGMDILWWLSVTGRLSRTIETMPDAMAARHEPSLQLVGRNDPARFAVDLDLGSLQGRGVRLVGRLASVTDGVARFGRDLGDNLAAADRGMHRFLDAVDRYVDEARLSRELWAGVRPGPVVVRDAPQRLDLRAEQIGVVLLAAGYRPDYPWLRLPVTGPDGHLRQRRGVTDAPGVYTVGQRFQHRRDSGFIDGARHDAHAVVAHLLAQGSADRPVPSEEPAA